MYRNLVLLLVLAPLMLAADVESTSRPAGVDPATWQRMLSIDAKASQVGDLTADFEQRKFTALLKKPLVSTGTVAVRGATMLWKTQRPQASTLQIDPREVRIYYPEQKIIEVYGIQDKLGQLAASPLPRLEVLRGYFTFEPLAASALGEQADSELFFAIRMTPTDAVLREHVEEVRVLLDVQRGLIIRLEMRDSDGESTLISFSNMQTNVKLDDADLRIAAPADVRITRPLAGMDDDGQTPSDGTRREGVK